MFTSVTPSDSAKIIALQGLRAGLAAPATVQASLIDIDNFKKAPRREPAKARPKERKGSLWNKKRLEKAEVREIFEIAFRVRLAGLPFNQFITIMPPVGMTQREAKDAIKCALKGLTQELTRAGAFNISLTVYEKERGGRLHAHIAIHVPHGLGGIVKRWVQNVGRGEDRHATPFRPYHVAYMTKQHRYLPPSFRPMLNGRPHPWQSGDRIIGPRWSTSKDLNAILGGVHAT